MSAGECQTTNRGDYDDVSEKEERKYVRIMGVTDCCFAGGR